MTATLGNLFRLLPNWLKYGSVAAIVVVLLIIIGIAIFEVRDAYKDRRY